MINNNKDSDHGIDTVRFYMEGLNRDFEIITSNNNNVATRLVWFVAIAGFALINVNKLAESIAGYSIMKFQLALLVSPWVLLSFTSIVTHWYLGELNAKDNEYFSLKQHAIRAWLANASKIPKISEVLEILNVDESDKDVAHKKSVVENLAPRVSKWENATFVILVIAFGWSILFPLVLGYCS